MQKSSNKILRFWDTLTLAHRHGELVRFIRSSLVAEIPSKRSHFIRQISRRFSCLTHVLYCYCFEFFHPPLITLWLDNGGVEPRILW